MKILNDLTEYEIEASKALSDALQISKLLAKLLVYRKITEPDRAQEFLNPQLENLHDPFLMRDMDKAVERIREALSRGEKILVYGDEDVDGISSTALLVDALRDLMGDVKYIIPNKAHDGVGLRKKYIDRAKAEGISLIITVDCGITNLSQVKYAQSIEIDVIITDHHIPLNELPAAIAVVNPKRKDDPYPFKLLSGAGVAYKLGQAVAMRLMNLTFEQWLSVKRQILIYVMLGTIGDRVPLYNENRIFVKFGLEELSLSKSNWVFAIGQNNRLNLRPKTISAILSNFIPLLSAGESVEGRNISCELLLSRNQQDAIEWASELYLTSQEWLYRARKAYKRMKIGLPHSDNSKIMIIVDKDTMVDVLSYCSSKLKDGFNKPVIVIGFKENSLIGEARAPKGFDLMSCFERCCEYFIDYGGHKCAAGFSSKIENLPNIVKRLSKAADEIYQNHSIAARPQFKVEIQLDEITPELISDITQLAPFGEENATPIFCCQNVAIRHEKSGFYAPEKDIIFWATRKIRHKWNFSFGEEVRVNITFIIDGSGKLFITYFTVADQTNADTENMDDNVI
ncbi:single-stranded-DNA-specific exonuclease RecJ [candidate division KSB1 bacterium]|nr:single-stranded-DNA-specific exonuclease RecJ [candidate division KSB1 bacterium]